MVTPGVNVELAADTHLEPDVAWSASEDDTGPAFDRTPELVIEVASPSSRANDRGTRKDRYAATGAREVWLVDLDHDTIEQYVVGARVAGGAVVHAVGEQFTSRLFEGVVFDVADLLDLSVGP